MRRLALGVAVVLLGLVLFVGWASLREGGDIDNGLFGGFGFDGDDMEVVYRSKGEDFPGRRLSSSSPSSPSSSSLSSLSCSIENDKVYDHRRLKNWVPSREDDERMEEASKQQTYKDYCWRKPRLVIFSQQRSGTHWLQQLLNSHPDVDIAPELAKHLGEKEDHLPTNEKDLVSYVKEKRSGFILQFNTFMNKAPGLLNKLADARFSFAHLVRPNSLDMIVSLEIDHLTGVIHCHVGEDCAVQQSTVKINTTRLIVEIGLVTFIRNKHLVVAYTCTAPQQIC